MAKLRCWVWRASGVLALSSCPSGSAFLAPLARPTGVPIALARAAAAGAGSACPPSSQLQQQRLQQQQRLYATASPPSPSSSSAGDQDKPCWQINLLYDSDCPLCMKEVDFLRKRDVEGNIKFTDLNDAEYKPEENGGIGFEEGMKVIHAVLPDGSTVKGVEVFRRVYEAIGLGWVYAVTKLPLVGSVADAAYDLWAVNRLRITGRPELEEILKERQAKIKGTDYDDCSDECEIKW